MPRPRVHVSPAARQQAYRARKRRAALAPDVVCRPISATCVVYLGHAEHVYPLLPRRAAVVTDPPYKINNDWTKARRRVSHWEQNFPGADQSFDPTPWLQFPEVILMGADHYWLPQMTQGAVWFWHKMPWQDPGDQSPCEIIWLSTPGPPRVIPHLWRGGMRAGEENYVHLQRKLHPAQKPINVMAYLVQHTAASVVIDPFMGSGTTLAACLRLGRPCIGIELDPAYFAVACERLQHEAEAARQGTLFPHAQATQAAD
jgi:site-specific DNA-methyltransferase (adenine-specific)/modification methylase